MAADLASTVESLGYRVRRAADSFDLLLPLWCSVRVVDTSERLQLEPRFGLIGRTWASWLTVLVVCLLWYSLRQQPSVDLAVAGFLFLMGIMWDVYRYILTEHAMDMVRHVYLETARPRA